ncbi:MAG: serine hydrolase [Chloroflexi bacterium]|nr:serine hydrolase [Chloroflexota bacterium]
MGQFTPVVEYVRSLVASRKLPSAVFGVADQNRVLELAAFGARPNGEPVQTTDPYLLWSVTKPIVGLAMMQLWERGLIHPGQEVRQHLPWFGKGRVDKVLLWHICTHTAGISEESAMPKTDKAAYLAGARVDFPAGAYKQYSNSAFIAQEEIVKAVTGNSLETHLRQHVFGPLGMRDTSFDTHELDPGRFVPMVGTEKVSLDYERFLRIKDPAAGLFSSAADLLALGRSLLGAGPSVIQRHTLAEMTRPQTIGIPTITPDDPLADIDFGLTWMIPSRSRALAHRAMFGHNGWGGCKFWIYPQDGVCFAFMTNLMDPGLHGVDLESRHNVFSSCL